MIYREFQPSPTLSSLVECFWLLEQEAPPPGTPPERLLPDGCVELILNCGARFRQFDAGGHPLLQPEYFVVGQMTRPVLIAPTGEVRLLGVRFAPGGTVPFLPVPPGELTNLVTPLDDVAGDLARRLRGPLEAAGTWSERLAVVDAALVRRLGETAPPAGTSLRPALVHLVGRGGRVAVDRMAADAGLCSRQLERRFLSEVGIGPKLLGRILRFQQVFRAVEGARADWATVAVACGYYDQAHLIRDFREFAGQTPSVLFEDLGHLTELFTRKRRVSHFSNTPQ